jgi:hypothetical protein
MPYSMGIGQGRLSYQKPIQQQAPYSHRCHRAPTPPSHSNRQLQLLQQHSLCNLCFCIG